MNGRYIFAAMVSLAFCSHGVWADESVVPGEGFAPEHYKTLWTKSPFSVASPDGAVESPDYSLVGLERFDGVSYANLFDKQKQEHFVLTSDKPARGLTLVSISPGHDPANSSAVIQRNGEPITLKLEVQAASGGAPMANGGPTPNPPNQPMPMAGFQNPGNPNAPGFTPPPGGMNPGNPSNPTAAPPQAMFHRRLIRVPSPPQQQAPRPPGSTN